MSTAAAPLRLCFVCLGNICRSPTAEGIMRAIVRQAGLDARIEVESAGTGTWHLGERADRRARATAATRGVTLDGLAQHFTRDDFERFDYVLAVDDRVRSELLSIARRDEERDKVRLFRSFDPASPAGAGVPDPYYGGQDGFDEVFDICDAGCRALLAHLRQAHALPDETTAQTRP
jgi:protein-tyrosine phosphatase